MILTPQQIHIFGAFSREPYRELTYREIKQYSRKNSNSAIQTSIAQFLSLGLVIKRELGNQLLYSVDLTNPVVHSYFALVLYEKLPRLVLRSFSIIQRELRDIPFCSVVVFGSYAEGNEQKNSDLDIAVFVRSHDDKKRAELGMNSAELASLVPLDAHVFTNDELLLMLKDTKENLGKQIAYKHLVVLNPMIFYAILAEGIAHGFKIVYRKIGE